MRHQDEVQNIVDSNNKKCQREIQRKYQEELLIQLEKAKKEKNEALLQSQQKEEELVKKNILTGDMAKQKEIEKSKSYKERIKNIMRDNLQERERIKKEENNKIVQERNIEKIRDQKILMEENEKKIKILSEKKKTIGVLRENYEEQQAKKMKKIEKEEKEDKIFIEKYGKVVEENTKREREIVI